MAWKLGVNFSKVFIYHSNYKNLLIELIKKISINQPLNYNQIGMIIGQEIMALEHLLELIEHSPEAVSQEEINHNLDQLDRCVERHLLSVKI